jgi:acyl carrier protein
MDPRMLDQNNTPSENATTASELSDLESRVARIWTDALERTDPIGPHDSFFALGGESLSMMIVLFQIGEQLGVELSQATLLEAASLRQFCAVVESARNELATQL